MKVIACLTFYWILVASEPPLSGYSPRGWRPQGPNFNLPNANRQFPNQQPLLNNYYIANRGRVAGLVPSHIPNIQLTEQSQGFSQPNFFNQQNVGFGNQQQFRANNRLLGGVQQQQAQPFARQLQTQNGVYGTPTSERPSYTTPRREEKPSSTTQASTTTREDATEPYENSPRFTPSIAVATAVSRGQYYILQPDGKLQKVVFTTSQNPDDKRKSAFTANLMYETVEPITDPIYSISENGPLVRIN